MNNSVQPRQNKKILIGGGAAVAVLLLAIIALAVTNGSRSGDSTPSALSVQSATAAATATMTATVEEPAPSTRTRTPLPPKPPARPNDLNAVLAAMSGELRQAVGGSCKPFWSPDAEEPKFQCTIAPTDPLVVGVTREGREVTAYVSIDPYPARTVRTWRLDDDPIIERGSSTAQIDAGKFTSAAAVNADSGLSVKARTFTSKETAQTFLERAQLLPTADGAKPAPPAALPKATKDLNAVLAVMPAPLRQAVSCTQAESISKRRESEGIGEFTCKIRSEDMLVTGLMALSYVSFVVYIEPNPPGYDPRNSSNPGELVERPNAVAKVHLISDGTADIRYLNSTTGLYIYALSGFANRDAAVTFLNRAGL
ncbi:MAG: hypothetical protein HOQ24_19285 [Mycobacteriaceae bacterium]|nr:hypothetical protein [Mycobacteriaceae bacterium]